MEVQSMTDALREFFEAPADRGVLVVRVIAGRAAAQAGIQVGDVLTTVGGEPIGEPLHLIAAVARVPAGAKLALEVVRQRKTETITVTPEGDPVEFTRPAHGEQGHGAQQHEDFHEEVLRRLQAIEQRLEQMDSR
jgi:C-terminal processing protease CtpA/Prc